MKKQSTQAFEKVYGRLLFCLALLLLLLCSPLLLPAQTQYWYGSIHSHSEYSDGNQANDTNYHTVKSCFEYIRQHSLQVDFWGISDHNHGSAGMAKADYHKGILEADSVNQDHIFTSLYGMEWGVISSGGHVIIHGIDSLIGWENGNYDIYNGETDYNGLFTKIAQRGDDAFAYLAHMDETDYNNLLAAPYNVVWDSAIIGLALRNGPAFSSDTTYSSLPSFNYFDRYLDLLKKGYHIAPGIDHDNHYIVFGRTHPGRTVVITDSLKREHIMEAFKRRSFYASDDWNSRVEFSVNGYGMGSICSGSLPATIYVKPGDPDNESINHLKIWAGIPGSGTSATVIFTAQGAASDSVHLNVTLPAGSTYYYFAEITQADGDKIWTAPVWYTRNGNPPAFELLSFSAKNVENKAQLYWTTGNEINLDRIDIEKSSDALLFNLAGSKAPAGGPGIITDYTWTDPLAINATVFYRLNIVDNAGLSQTSTVQRVDPLIPSSGFIIYPNPVNATSAQISVSHTREEPCRLEIFSAEGKLMYQSVFLAAFGVITLPLPAENLGNGMYTLRITNSDYSFNKSNRFILHSP